MKYTVFWVMSVSGVKKFSIMIYVKILPNRYQAWINFNRFRKVYYDEYLTILERNPFTRGLTIDEVSICCRCGNDHDMIEESSIPESIYLTRRYLHWEKVHVIVVSSDSTNKTHGCVVCTVILNCKICKLFYCCKTNFFSFCTIFVYVFV